MATHIEKYLQLLSTKTVVHPNDYRIDLSNAKESPVPLPGTYLKTTPLSANVKSSSAEGKVSLKFKLVIPPHKFTADLSLPSSYTIYEAKEALAKQLATEGKANLVAAQLKVMVKSKVPSDSLPLAELEPKDGPVAITVIVGKAPKVVAEPLVPVGAPKELEISSAAWEKIGAVLTEELGPEHGKKALQRLQKGW